MAYFHFLEFKNAGRLSEELFLFNEGIVKVNPGCGWRE